jgi:3-dehydroquinate dehydratase-2
MAMKRSVYILNGPNLNLLGEREPQLYGHATLAEIEELCSAAGARLGLAIVFRQSNHEGQLIDWVHEARREADGIVINPAGYSFTSVALLDSLKASELPIVEVHITNIHRREALYQKSLVSFVARGVICGLGPLGYELALTAMADALGTSDTAGAPPRRRAQRTPTGSVPRRSRKVP